MITVIYINLRDGGPSSIVAYGDRSDDISIRDAEDGAPDGYDVLCSERTKRTITIYIKKRIPYEDA